MARKIKLKINDTDLIDVILRDIHEKQQQEINVREKKVEKLQEEYKAKLQAAFQASPKGKALLKIYPNLLAERISGWRSDVNVICFDLCDEEGRRISNYNRNVDELHGEIAIPRRKAKVIRGLRDAIGRLQDDIRKMKEEAKHVVWKRNAIKSSVDDKTMAKIRQMVERAFKARYAGMKL
jgi:hypothetical protein